MSKSKDIVDNNRNLPEFRMSAGEEQKEVLERPALPGGRAPCEVTEHGSFRDRLNNGRCGGERCPLNPGEQRRRSVKFTQKPDRNPEAIL